MQECSQIENRDFFTQKRKFYVILIGKKWCFAQVRNALQNNGLTWRNPGTFNTLPE